jgi:hypothetical protein
MTNGERLTRANQTQILFHQAGKGNFFGIK